jgi:hypothetical protein
MERRALTPRLRCGRPGRTIAGYAAVFNSETRHRRVFPRGDRAGAPSPSLKGDVRALFDHDTGQACWAAPSRARCVCRGRQGPRRRDRPSRHHGRPRPGRLDGARRHRRDELRLPVTKQEWDETSDPPASHDREVELFEVSAVTFPAYADTEIALRSLEDARKDERKAEAEAQQEGRQLSPSARPRRKKVPRI